MIGVVGDLLVDIVTTILLPPTGRAGELAINIGSDTPVRIRRRLGGSAANVAVTAAGLGIPCRFIGQVGDDRRGDELVAELERRGVEVVARRGGDTGAVIVLLHPDGERSMLTQRGAATLLADPDPGWLDGLGALHIPLYSLYGEPLARTTISLAAAAAERSLPVTVDLSSTALLRTLGHDAIDLVRSVSPAVVLANADEAAVAAEIGADLADLGARATVVKRGSEAADLITAAGTTSVPAIDLGPVADTTGAGDAFAAGLLVALTAGQELEAAVVSGHRAAARHLRALSGQVVAQRGSLGGRPGGPEANARSASRDAAGSPGQADSGWQA